MEAPGLKKNKLSTFQYFNRSPPAVLKLVAKKKLRTVILKSRQLKKMSFFTVNKL